MNWLVIGKRGQTCFPTWFYRFCHTAPQRLYNENKRMECGSLNAIQKTQGCRAKQAVRLDTECRNPAFPLAGTTGCSGANPQLPLAALFTDWLFGKPRTAVMLFTSNLLVMYCIPDNAKPHCAMAYPGKVR